MQTTTACHILQRLQGGLGREALADAARPGGADAVVRQAAGECGTNMCVVKLQTDNNRFNHVI